MSDLVEQLRQLRSRTDANRAHRVRGRVEIDLAVLDEAIAALEAQPRLPKIAPEGHTRETAIRCYKSGLSPYGFCPTCFRVGTVRERRPNGNDQCAAGHTYPSLDALSPHQVPEAQPSEHHFGQWSPAQPESVKPERESLVEDQGILDDFQRHFGMSVGAWFERDTCSASERFVLTWLIRWLASIDRKLDEARK